MSDSNVRECKDCGFISELAYEGSQAVPRCLPCHRKMKKSTMAKARLAKKKEWLASSGSHRDGWFVCTKCYKHKRLSEYGTTKGERNCLCDTCLTGVMNSKSRRNEGFTEAFWRRRAYTCNTVGRQRAAARLFVKVTEISLSDMEYVCKPQDLIQIFEKQKGQCFYCAKPLSSANKETSVDRAQPLSRGGAHIPENFRICCYDCNRLKYERTDVEFLKFLEEYKTRKFRVAEPTDKEP